MGPGTLLAGGKYEVRELLGEGGFGSVYLAKSKNLGREVAVKVSKPSKLGPQGGETQNALIRRFYHEAEIQAQFSHPNLVHVYDGFFEDDRYHVVMERIRGSSLAEYPFGQGGVSVEESTSIVLQIMRGLDVVHDHPWSIVHRDIKPSNILISDDGTAKLADFGVALSADGETCTLFDGAHPGTLLYMSPEQANNEPFLSGASDVYSLGCVYFELLSGKPYKAAQASGENLHDLRRGVPRKVKRAVDQMLSNDPKERPNSSAELERILRDGVLPKSGLYASFLVAVIGALIVLALGAIWPWDGAPTPIPSPTIGSEPIVVPANTLPPESTVTLESIEALVGSPTATVVTDATETPTVTLTVSRTPTPTATASVVPLPSVAASETPLIPTVPLSATPQPVEAPDLVQPSQGQTYKNPIVFAWVGALGSGQVFQVKARSIEKPDSVLLSPALLEASWEAELPGEAYGEWRWLVMVVEDNVAVATSEERMFWLDPGFAPAAPVLPVTPSGPDR